MGCGTAVATGAMLNDRSGSLGRQPRRFREPDPGLAGRMWKTTERGFGIATAAALIQCG